MFDKIFDWVWHRTVGRKMHMDYLSSENCRLNREVIRLEQKIWDMEGHTPEESSARFRGFLLDFDEAAEDVCPEYTRPMED